MPAGPWLLDLGSILYAPTTFRAADGRLIMVAWLQELREGGGFAYAGCLSVPRLLHLAGDIPHPPNVHFGRSVHISHYCQLTGPKLENSCIHARRTERAAPAAVHVSVGLQRVPDVETCTTCIKSVPVSKLVQRNGTLPIILTAPLHERHVGCAEGQLYQEPVPEVARLRADAAFQAARLQVSPQQPVRVAGLRRPCFDLRLTLQPGPAGSAAGVLLRPWLHVGSGAAHPCAAAILLTWQSDQPLLEVRSPLHQQQCAWGRSASPWPVRQACVHAQGQLTEARLSDA